MNPNNSSKKFRSKQWLVLLAISASATTGCGGSGSDDGGGGTGGTPTPEGFTGILIGPVGAEASLHNGDDTVSVTVPAAPTAEQPLLYYAKAFTFELEDGQPYAVSVTSVSANLDCQVYMGASGQTPVAEGALRVGCEHRVDHVSRNSDDTTLVATDGWDAAVLGGGAGVTAGEGEGRFVAFVSDQNVTGNANAYRHIFWRDRATSTTLLVSASDDGTPGNNNSWEPAISADGLTVAFQSYANNLVANDANGVPDIFVWKIDPEEGTTAITRVNLGPSGEEANELSEYPTISGDGNVVAFETWATNVVPHANDSAIYRKVVRRDLTTGTNTLVAGTVSNRPGTGARPAISENGNRIAFWSYDELDGDQTVSLWDIFVYQHDTDTRWPVSLTHAGGAREQGDDSVSGIRQPAISGDGKWVTYATTATNVMADTTQGEQQFYVVEVDACDSASCNVQLVSANDAGDEAETGADSDYAPLSLDGRYIAFRSAAHNLGFTPSSTGIPIVYVRDRVASVTRNYATQSVSGSLVSLSRNAAYVGYGSTAHDDPRFPNQGAFARFTGLADAFAWQRD